MRRYRELTQPQRAGVPPGRARPADAVTKVLAPEIAEAGARLITDADLGVQVNASAQRALTAVELGIFVVAERLVVAARAAKAVHSKRSVMTMVHESAASACAMG